MLARPREAPYRCAAGRRRPHRLAVRTSPFHGEDRGSIPRGDATILVRPGPGPMKISIPDDYFRHAAHARLLPQARRSRRHGLERPRAGRRSAGRPPPRHRSPRADPGAHQNWRRVARPPAETQADQPAQRLSAHRHRRLHEARHHRIVEPASRNAVLCCRGTDLGPNPCGREPDPTADGVSQGRQLADRRRHHAARQDAGHLRLRPDRRGRSRLRQGVRDERGGMGAAAIAGAGARGRLRGQQAGIL